MADLGRARAHDRLSGDGMALARLEGEAVLTALARHAARIELAGEPRRQPNNTLRGFETLPLRLLPG